MTDTTVVPQKKAKPSVAIRNWRIFPEQDGRFYLSGELFGHPTGGDVWVSTPKTSPLVRIDFEQKMAETKNTIYRW